MTINLGDALVFVGLMAQAAALFYWAGKTHQIMVDHERRILRLEVGHRSVREDDSK